MADHNDDSSMTESNVTGPVTTRQNELIAQLMQEIVDMKEEIRKTQELARLAIVANPPILNNMRPIRAYYQPPLPNHRSQDHPSYRPVPPLPQNNHDPPHPRTCRRPHRAFTPLTENRTTVFKRLTDAALIQPVPPKAMNPNSRFFKSGQICAYHSNSVGHDTEECKSLKHKIQDLIDERRVVRIRKDSYTSRETVEVVVRNKT